MAVTSMWGCHGSIYTVTKYTANPVKAWNGEYSQAASFHRKGNTEGDNTVSAVMEYTADQMKTEKQLYVTGINCSDDPNLAAKQFYQTRDSFRNTGKIVCLHGYQSFKPGEVIPEEAHKIGVELAKRIWGEENEVLVSTHLNTGALHNHFVVNPISFKDGKRYLCNQTTYKVMREESDKLCREYGISVIDEPKSKKVNRYLALTNMEREGRYTVHAILKQDIDLAIASSPKDFDEFIALMEKMGYRLERRGKDLRIIPSIGKQKPRRLRSLGDGYSEYDIEERIQAQLWNPRRYDFKAYKPKRVAITSLHGLYVHYCYLLGIFPKERPQNRETWDALKEDKLKAEKYSDEARMLGKYAIRDLDDLKDHFAFVSEQYEKKMELRRKLRNSMRRMTDEAEIAETKAQVKDLAAEIRRLSREKELCEDVACRSAGIEAVVELIEEPEKRKQQEKENRRNRDE